MFLKKIATSSHATMRAVQAAKMPLMSAAPATRAFGHTKYAFDDEDWKPNQFQVRKIRVFSFTHSRFFSNVAVC